MKASESNKASARQLGLKSSIDKRHFSRSDRQGNHTNNNQLVLKNQASGIQLGLKNPKVLISLLIALLAATVAGVIWFSNTNATGALSQVNFPKVSIAEGSKFYLNGNKSLTAIKDEKLLADNTNGTAVEASQIESELSSFTNNQYGNDAGKSYLNRPKMISQGQVSDCRSYIPKTDNSYWIDMFFEQWGGLGFQGFCTENNELGQLVTPLNGETDDGIILDNVLLRSGYDFQSSGSFKDVYAGSGTYSFSFENPKSGVQVECNAYKLANKNLWDKTIYNNPYLKSDSSKSYYSANFVYDLILPRPFTQKKDDYEWWTGAYVLGKVKSGNIIIPLKTGDYVSSSDIIALEVFKRNDSSKLTSSVGFTDIVSDWSVLGFCRSPISFTVNDEKMKRTIPFLKEIDKVGITGTKYQAGKHAVKPAYNMNLNSVSFLRDSNDKTTSYSSTLSSNLPTSKALYGYNYVGVTKSSDLSVNCEISESNIETNYGSKAPIVIDGDTIKVPYGTTTLSFKNFSLNNANTLSALASDKDETLKYGILQSSNSSVFDLDITNLIDNQHVKTPESPSSSAVVTLYAEQINGNGESDVISESGVTFRIEMSEGVEQKIIYDINGGDGKTPASVTVKSGELCNAANCSDLSKDTNYFSAWKMTYIPFGKTDEISRYVTANQPFAVPLAENSKILMTAQYSGISAKKTTETTTSIYNVTWDSNAPEGLTAAWSEDIEGNYNTDRSIRYDKVKLKGSSIALPSAPTISYQGYYFEGWYNDPTGGTKIAGTSTPIYIDRTFYAHWKKKEDAFIADSDGFDPTNSSTYANAKITSIDEVISDASVFAAGDDPKKNIYLTDGFYSNWRLYVRIGGTIESTSADDWLECILIHKGQHDNDGSGLTFMATNVWNEEIDFCPDYDYESSTEANWKTSNLRAEMNDKVLKSFPTILQDKIKSIPKRSNHEAGTNPNGGDVDITEDKLWVLSYTELVNEGATKSEYWDDSAHDGSTYQLFSKTYGYNFQVDQSSFDYYGQESKFNYFVSKRSNRRKLDGDSWMRSVNPKLGGGLYFSSNGYISSSSGSNIKFDNYVNICFAL